MPTGIYNRHPGKEYSDGFVRKDGHRMVEVNGKQVFEHRYLMEKYLGRKLSSNEMVHHINHDKLDNRIKNLQLVTKSEHKKLHPKIGENTRFKKKHYLDPAYVYKVYIELRSAGAVAKKFGCSEITIRRIIKKLTNKSLNELAIQLEWPFTRWRNHER